MQIENIDFPELVLGPKKKKKKGTFLCCLSIDTCLEPCFSIYCLSTNFYLRFKTHIYGRNFTFYLRD